MVPAEKVRLWRWLADRLAGLGLAWHLCRHRHDLRADVGIAGRGLSCRGGDPVRFGDVGADPGQPGEDPWRVALAALIALQERQCPCFR